MNQSNNNTVAIFLTFAVLLVGIWVPIWWLKIPATFVILFTAWGILNQGEEL